MSNPSKPSDIRPLAAIGFLGLTFAAGLVLVAFNVSGPTEAPAPPPDPGVRVEQVAAELRTLAVQVTDTQHRLQTLEAQLTAWQRTQAAELATELANERQRLLAEVSARIDEMRAAVPPPAPGTLPQLVRELAPFDGRLTEQGILIPLGEAVLRFPPGSAAAPAPPPAILTQLAAVLAAHPALQVRLLGHTDAAGSADANLTLSEQRAAMVKTLLVAQGIAAERIQSAGRGEAEPIAPNDTADGRRRNRRVDLYLTD